MSEFSEAAYRQQRDEYRRKHPDETTTEVENIGTVIPATGWFACFDGGQGEPVTVFPVVAWAVVETLDRYVYTTGNHDENEVAPDSRLVRMRAMVVDDWSMGSLECAELDSCFLGLAESIEEGKALYLEEARRRSQAAEARRTAYLKENPELPKPAPAANAQGAC